MWLLFIAMLKIVLCMWFVWSALLIQMHSSKQCFPVCGWVWKTINNYKTSIHIKTSYVLMLYGRDKSNPACRTEDHIFRSFICTSRGHAVRQPQEIVCRTNLSGKKNGRTCQHTNSWTKAKCIMSQRQWWLARTKIKIKNSINSPLGPPGHWAQQQPRLNPTGVPKHLVTLVVDLCKGKDVNLWFQQNCRIMISNVQQWTSNLNNGNNEKC